MKSLPEWLAGVLAAEGAVVEPVVPDGLDVMLPVDLQTAFNADEFMQMSFGMDRPAGAKRVTIESDWVDILGRRVQSRARLLETHFETVPGKIPDPADVLSKTLSFTNATYRFTTMEPGYTHYRVMPLMISAVSDEKREDVAVIVFNESNMTRNDALGMAFIAQLREGKGAVQHEEIPQKLPPAWTADYMRKIVVPAARATARCRLVPFLASMDRRLARDLDRIHSYHEELCREAARKRTDGKGRQANTKDAEKVAELRLAAIRREYESKVADVRLKYNVSVDINLLQVMRVALPVQRLGFVIRRRKGERPFHLDWNSLTRKPDSLVCEACGIITDTAAICDEHLHILCPACLSACPVCAKAYCRACRSDGCPGCRTGKPAS